MSSRAGDGDGDGEVLCCGIGRSGYPDVITTQSYDLPLLHSPYNARHRTSHPPPVYVLRLIYLGS